MSETNTIFYNQDNQPRVYLKADNGKLSKIIRFNSGNEVEIPINRDGSIHWVDDTKLIKKQHFERFDKTNT